MATITSKQVDQFQGFSTLISWGAMSGAGGDVGEGVYVGHLTFLSVWATGTNTGVVTWQGSMDNATWNALNTATATTIDATGAGKVQQVVDPPLFIRPVASVAAISNAFVLGKRFS